jgi:transcription initiation factor TFIID TATA-box-binding protein
MKIVNIVCSGDLKTEINLEEISKSGNSAFIYDPSNYHGGYIILSNAKATIYKTGRYIIVGLKSIDEVERAFFELKNFLSRFVDVSSAEKPEIKNIVAMGDLKTHVDLTKFSLILGLENVEYEPEQFPGMVYRDNKLTALIFSSGKIILAGATDVKELEEFFNKIKELFSMT